MPRSSGVNLGLTALAVALGAGIVFAVRGAAPPEAADPRPAVTAPPAVASGPPATVQAPRAARPPRPGRTLALDVALRELDLIKPARQKIADNFTLPLPGGESFRLSEQRGKVVIVNFWATWCPPCREEMPAMERLYRQHKNNGLVMLAVSVDADPKVVTPFVKEHRLSFTIGLDSRMEVADAYGVRALPSTFIVDRQGNLAALALGPRVWDNDAAHSLVEGLAR
jgi:peroxiredoxin